MSDDVGPVDERGTYLIQTLTVVFIDIVKSVATKERLGQEPAESLFRSVEKLLRKEVSRNGGTTVKALGDGLMATFSSASAAIRAACSAHQTVANHGFSEPIKLCSGVATGDVIVEDGDIKGLAADEASRLQTEADPDTVLVSAATFILARGRTDCVLEQGPELHLRGINEPVRTYRILWQQSPAGNELEVRLPERLRAETRSRFPFADRRSEMDTLRSLTGGVKFRLVIVRGPSGIGKTRLLAEWSESARRRGTFVLYFGADPTSDVTPLDLKGSLREFFSSRAHTRLLGSSWGYKKAFDRLSEVSALMVRGADLNQREVVESFVDLIVQLGEDSPTLLVVDDIQYASEATLELLTSLLRGAYRGLSIIGAVTSDLSANEVSISDEELLRRFPLSEHVERLDLRPLDYDGVVEWLENQPRITLGKDAPVRLDSAGEEIAKAFYEASGGNPTILGLVIRESYEVERQVSMDDEGHWRSACDLNVLYRSRSVERIVLDRLRKLTREERELLGACSVIGPDVDTDLLQRVAGKDLDTIEQLLAGSRRRSFIRDDDGLDRFETEATRRVIYRVLPGPVRSRWHETVADALRGRATDARALTPHLQIARHLAEVARIDAGRRAEDAAEHFLAAADRALKRVPADAVSFAHDALAILDKFELVNDSQLRTRAEDIVSEAQRLRESKPGLRASETPWRNSESGSDVMETLPGQE